MIIEAHAQKMAEVAGSKAQVEASHAEIQTNFSELQEHVQRMLTSLENSKFK